MELAAVRLLLGLGGRCLFDDGRLEELHRKGAVGVDDMGVENSRAELGLLDDRSLGVSHLQNPPISLPRGLRR